MTKFDMADYAKYYWHAHRVGKTRAKNNIKRNEALSEFEKEKLLREMILTSKAQKELQQTLDDTSVYLDKCGFIMHAMPNPCCINEKNKEED